MWLIRLLYRFPYCDLGLFRVVRFSSLFDLTMRWTVEMEIKAIQKKLRIMEGSVRYRKRAGGASKVTRTIKGTVLAGYKILLTVFRYVWRNV